MVRSTEIIKGEWFLKLRQVKDLERLQDGGRYLLNFKDNWFVTTYHGKTGEFFCCEKAAGLHPEEDSFSIYELD